MEGGDISRNATLICVPIMAESVDKMVIDAGKAKASGADLVEIRLDSLKSFSPLDDLKTIITECPLPTLFTYRFVTLIMIFHFSSDFMVCRLHKFLVINLLLSALHMSFRL